MDLNWKDLAIAGLIVCFVFVLLNVLLPISSVSKCSGSCEASIQQPTLTFQNNVSPQSNEAILSDCECGLIQIREPFTHYLLLRSIFLPLLGLIYYYSKQKPSWPITLLVFGIMFIVYVVAYLLFPIIAGVFGLYGYSVIYEYTTK